MINVSDRVLGLCLELFFGTGSEASAVTLVLSTSSWHQEFSHWWRRQRRLSVIVYEIFLLFQEAGNDCCGWTVMPVLPGFFFGWIAEFLVQNYSEIKINAVITGAWK